MTAHPSERALRARLAAHALHAKVADPSAHTAPARKAFLDRFEREVDPDGVLPPAERARRAEHARKAYMGRLALKSAQARRKASTAAGGHREAGRGGQPARPAPHSPDVAAAEAAAPSCEVYEQRAGPVTVGG